MTPRERDTMAAIFGRCGVEVPPAALDRFARFYDLLVAHNDDRDLSRLTDFDDIIIKHFVDSCLAGILTELPAPLLDIGTGAGFPGIPLAIMNPDLPIILAEPRRRRVAFLETAVAALDLRRVTIYPHLVTDKSQFTVGAVITRALEAAGDTLERVDHFLTRGARVVLLKGPEAGTDIAAMPPHLADSYRLEKDLAYRLGDTEHRRRLLVYVKESDTMRRTFRIMKDEKETPGTPITSPDNRSFKEWKRLLDGDGIRREGMLLLAGKKIITDVVNRAGVTLRDVIVFDGYVEDDPWFMDRMAPPAPAILKKALYNELDLFNTRGPLATVTAPALADWDGTLPPGCTVALAFQDPVNVGSAIRSAAGFGAAQVLMLREAAHPFHPRAVRASAGAVFTVPLRRGPSLAELAARQDATPLALVCLDQGGEPLDGMPFPESFMLLPGLEGPGLPASLRKRAAAIPLAGDIESLNGPIALAVALYEWRRRDPHSPSNSQSVKSE